MHRKFLLPIIPIIVSAFALSSTSRSQEAPMSEASAVPAETPTAPAADETAPAPEKAPAAAKPKKEVKPFAPDITSSKPGAAKVRLFILSGQSNMTGLNPAKSFTPAVNAAFPDDDVVVVKDSQSGQPIRRWLKDWKPAEGVEADKKAKGTGDLYERLTKSIATAMEGKPEPVSVVFVWMQGEADAKAVWSANNYDQSLKELIGLVRADMKAPKMPAVIGHLSDYDNPKLLPAWATVKTKQEEVVKADPLLALVETDDLNGPKNGLHYDGPGYTELGQRFADAAIKLIKEAK